MYYGWCANTVRRGLYSCSSRDEGAGKRKDGRAQRNTPTICTRDIPPDRAADQQHHREGGQQGQAKEPRR